MAGPFDFLFGEAPSGDPNMPAYNPSTRPAYSGGLPGLIDYFTGQPSEHQLGRQERERDFNRSQGMEMKEREARVNLATKAAQLLEQNEGAPPNALFKQLMQDPDALSQMMNIPSGKHAQAIQDVIKNLTPTPPKVNEVEPGKELIQTDPYSSKEVGRIKGPPLTPQQMGVGRAVARPQIVRIPNQFGEPTDRFGQVVTDENGQTHIIPVQGAGGQVGSPHGVAQPTVTGAAPGQVPQPTASLVPRKADMVDVFGPAGMVSQKMGSIAGNFDPEAGAARQQAAFNQLQQLRGSLVALGGSSRLKNELRAKEALIPPDNPVLWSPIRGAQSLVQLHDYVSSALQRAEFDINSPYSSNKVKKDADQERTALTRVIDQLGPKEELVAKLAELNRSQGGTSAGEVLQTVPGIGSVRKYMTPGAKGQQPQPAPGPQGAAPPAAKPGGISEFAKDLSNVPTSDFIKLKDKLPEMAPEEQDAYRKEITRRRKILESFTSPGGAAPANPKGQDRLPPESPVLPPR